MAGKPTKLPVEPGSGGSGLWWAAGVQEHPQGSAHSSASRNKEGKSEWTFSAGSLLWWLHHSLPSPAEIGHRFSFSPSAGSFSPSAGSLWGTPMAPGAICNNNQQDKWSHLWIKHFSVPLIWSNIAHQSFWKTAISHLKPESCETNSFLQERVMMLRVCLNANQCLSFVSCELKHWAKSSAHVWHNTHWTQEESHWQWQPNRSRHKSTLMNLMPSYPINIHFGAEPQPIYLVYMLEKKVQTKQQIFNKTDVPSFRLLQLLCYNMSLAEAITFLLCEPWCSFTCFIYIY